MRARVRYENTDRREGYVIEICVEKQSFDDWAFESFFPFVRREGASDDEEKNFIHFSIINKIAELTDLGYKVTFW